MPRIAIYGRQFSEDFSVSISGFFDLLAAKGVAFSVYDQFAGFLSSQLGFSPPQTFARSTFDPKKFDLLISIGGDGTMLDSTAFVLDSGLPILGLNTGRLGFLSSISLGQIEEAVNDVIAGAYMIDKRTVLKLESEEKIFEQNFALNEMTIHKNDTQSMIVIHAYVDGKFLNTYWADGLIIATPTGSTAYSLSCGGPIILPSSANFVITPVAPHNLNVRPVLISDQSVVTLRVEGRSEQFLTSLDSRSASIGSDAVLTVMKNDFTVNLVRLKSHSFLKTLRTKLHWGYDRRN